jgi:hypothetical protein
MRMIFETVDGVDYFEIILEFKDLEKIKGKGLTRDFSEGLEDRPLNVFLRMPRELEEDFMPLVKGKAASSKSGFSTNVKREMEAGKPQKQAVAIAYSEARKGKKGAKKK